MTLRNCFSSVGSACAALEPGTGQDRHRSTAQLSGGESRDSGSSECETRVRQKRLLASTAEPRTATNLHADANDVFAVFAARHALGNFYSASGRSVNMSCHAQAPSAARVSSSQKTRSPVRGVGQIYQHHPKPVYWFLTGTRSLTLCCPCSPS